jgi:hypothetical protein
VAFGDQDLDSFFRDGDQVTRAGGQPAFMAHFDIPEVIDNFSPMNVRASEVAARPVIGYATASASDLAHNEQITVRGVTYRVRSTKLKNDGQVSEAELSLP